MKIDMKKMGARIKQIRGEMSLLEFEAIARVSRSMLSLYENGAAWPKPDALNNIAAHGKVGVEWILGYDAAAPIEKPTTEEALVLAITSDPARLEKVQDKLLHRVSEKMPPDYNSGLSDQEHQLIEAYHCAEEVIKEEALGMLVRSAERLKGSGGGTKGLKQSNGE